MTILLSKLNYCFSNNNLKACLPSNSGETQNYAELSHGPSTLSENERHPHTGGVESLVPCFALFSIRHRTKLFCLHTLQNHSRS